MGARIWLSLHLKKFGRQNTITTRHQQDSNLRPQRGRDTLWFESLALTTPPQRLMMTLFFYPNMMWKGEGKIQKITYSSSLQYYQHPQLILGSSRSTFSRIWTFDCKFRSIPLFKTYNLSSWHRSQLNVQHPRYDSKKIPIYTDVFQKLLKAEANRRVRMCNLQSAKDCASVKTSLATVRARAQEWGKWRCGGWVIYWWVEGRLVAVVGALGQVSQSVFGACCARVSVCLLQRGCTA